MRKWYNSSDQHWALWFRFLVKFVSKFLAKSPTDTSKIIVEDKVVASWTMMEGFLIVLLINHSLFKILWWTWLFFQQFGSLRSRSRIIRTSNRDFLTVFSVKLEGCTIVTSKLLAFFYVIKLTLDKGI